MGLMNFIYGLFLEWKFLYRRWSRRGCRFLVEFNQIRAILKRREKKFQFRNLVEFSKQIRDIQIFVKDGLDNIAEKPDLFYKIRKNEATNRLVHKPGKYGDGSESMISVYEEELKCKEKYSK